MNVKEIERPLSLSELATVQLREAIVNGDLKLGEALSEATLATRLKISKTPVRHALAQMRVEGLVEVYPQSGTFVFTVSAGDLMQLCEHRLVLERAALRLAFERNYDRLCRRMRAITTSMDRARIRADVRRYLTLDTEFHRVILKFADNQYLLESYNLIEAKTAAIRTHLADRPLQSEQSLAEHEKIVAFLESGDLDAAISVLEYHIERYSRCYDPDTDDIAARERGERLKRITASGEPGGIAEGSAPARSVRPNRS